mgnify:CR=1 FL=1
MWNDDNKKIFADREVMLEALKSFSWAFEYADDSLLADREVMLEALEIDMSREDDWSDGDFAASVDRQTHFLQYAADTLKSDREFILGAGALEYADDTLKADREVVLEAVKNDGEVLRCLFGQPTDNDDYDDIKSDDDIPF